MALLAASLAALAGVLAIPSGLPAASEPDEGCPSAFPRLVTPGRPDLVGLVVCSDAAGTSTFVRNETPAVLAIESASPVAVGAHPLSAFAESFAALVEAPGSFVPSEAIAVVPRPVERITLRVDAALTIAQLTHDQLVESMGSKGGPSEEALSTEPSTPRRALTACLLATLEQVESPGCALADGAPATVIAEAAAAVDANGRSPCGAAWLEAKINANLPAGATTAFVSDIVAWELSPAFAARGEAAAALYQRLRPEDRPG